MGVHRHVRNGPGDAEGYLAWITDEELAAEASAKSAAQAKADKAAAKADKAAAEKKA